MLLFILGSDVFHVAIGQKSFHIQMHLEISQDTGDALQLVEMGSCLLPTSYPNLIQLEFALLIWALRAICPLQLAWCNQNVWALKWEQLYSAKGLALRPCRVELSLCPSSIPRSIICRINLHPSSKSFPSSLKPHLGSWKVCMDGDQATTPVVLKPIVAPTA